MGCEHYQCQICWRYYYASSISYDFNKITNRGWGIIRCIGCQADCCLYCSEDFTKTPNGFYRCRKCENIVKKICAQRRVKRRIILLLIAHKCSKRKVRKIPMFNSNDIVRNIASYL